MPIVPGLPPCRTAAPPPAKSVLNETPPCERPEPCWNLYTTHVSSQELWTKCQGTKPVCLLKRRDVGVVIATTLCHQSGLCCCPSCCLARDAGALKGANGCFLGFCHLLITLQELFNLRLDSCCDETLVAPTQRPSNSLESEM